jgi:hypothetical protein
MKGLSEIQSALKAPKSQVNSFGKYNYRKCEDILEAVKPLLAHHHATLTMSDSVSEVAGVPFITATVTYTDVDGKSISITSCAGIDVHKKGMDVAQTFGASSSYARKYALNGLFLIDDTKDADSEDNSNKSGFTAPLPPIPSTSFETAIETIISTPERKNEVLKRLEKYNLTSQQRKELQTTCAA